MDSYTSMKNKLQPIGIYSFGEKSAVECELKAYAACLDALFNELDTMLREYFITTAESYGIVEREKFTGREQTELTAQQRREKLMTSEKPIDGTFSINDFKRFLAISGITDYSLTEAFGHNRVNMVIRDNLTDTQRAMLEEAIKNAVPINLICAIKYGDTAETRLIQNGI